MRERRERKYYRNPWNVRSGVQGRKFPGRKKSKRNDPLGSSKDRRQSRVPSVRKPDRRGEGRLQRGWFHEPESEFPDRIKRVLSGAVFKRCESIRQLPVCQKRILLCRRKRFQRGCAGVQPYRIPEELFQAAGSEINKNFEMEQSSRLDETDIPGGCSFCQGRWEDE